MIYIKDYRNLSAQIAASSRDSLQTRLNDLMHRKIIVFTHSAAPFKGILTCASPGILKLILCLPKDHTPQRENLRRNPSASLQQLRTVAVINREHITAIAYNELS